MSGILQNFAYGRAFTSAPVNTVAPAVTGTATFGSTLSCTTGTWTGIPTPTYTYQWQRVTTPISGATSSTYVLVQADVGSTIRCVVTATNSTAAVSANSNSTATVAATVPGAPTIGTATASGSTGATVSYTAPASNGGSNITTYTATSLPGGITGTLSTSGSGTITVSGLTTGTAYTFTVTATNAIGTSSSSAASNSITPVASGFLATEKYNASNNNGSIALAHKSSGVIYKVPTGFSSGQSSTTVIQYSTTGTKIAAKYGFNDSYNRGISIDSSDNSYYIGYMGSTLQTTKANSADVVQWSKTQAVSWSLDIFNKPVIDSSGNVYVSYTEMLTVCCCPNIYAYYMRKYNSSGAPQPLLGINFSGGGANYVNGYGGIGIDSSGNIYNVFNGIGYPYGAVVIYKTSSTGTAVANKFYTRSNTPGGSRNGNLTSYNYIFDTANSVGYIPGSGASGFVAKHDTSLAFTWIYEFTSVTAFKGIALDSSGNVYAVGYKNGASYTSTAIIIKLNSSGTLQWAREFSASGVGIDSSVIPYISVSGSKYVFSWTIFNPSTNISIAFTFQAPTDGSGTGTISNAGRTWTYASFSTSASSPNTVGITEGSQSAAGASTATATPSIQTADLWATSTTSF